MATAALRNAQQRQGTSAKVRGKAAGPTQYGNLAGRPATPAVNRAPAPGVTLRHKGGMHRPVGATEQTPAAAPVPGAVQPVPARRQSEE